MMEVTDLRAPCWLTQIYHPRCGPAAKLNAAELWWGQCVGRSSNWGGETAAADNG